MAQPAFTHIHCSSRFDRSAASLETAVDDWRTKSSLITMTEVANDRRAATLRETGWGYFNAKKDNGGDECAICWDRDRWRLKHSEVKKLTNVRFTRLNGKPARSIWSASVVLRLVATGHRVLITVTHMPAHVEGANQWRTTTDHWRARKEAYLSSLKNWSIHVKDMERRLKPDATMVVSDWNLNLKQHWVRHLIHDNFGGAYKQAWVRFPTSGGSLTGGNYVPLGAPGRGYHDRIIDGTLYRGLKVTDEPNLMVRSASSDHRPYKEGFRLLDAADHPSADYDPTGDTFFGDEWWGFGDYMDDELYQLDRATETS